MSDVIGAEGIRGVACQSALMSTLECSSIAIVLSVTVFGVGWKNHSRTALEDVKQVVHVVLLSGIDANLICGV